MTEVEADRMTGKRKATGFPIKDVGNDRKGGGFLSPSPLAGEGRGEGERVRETGYVRVPG